MNVAEDEAPGRGGRPGDEASLGLQATGAWCGQLARSVAVVAAFLREADEVEQRLGGGAGHRGSRGHGHVGGDAEKCASSCSPTRRSRLRAGGGQADGVDHGSATRRPVIRSTSRIEAEVEGRVVGDEDPIPTAKARKRRTACSVRGAPRSARVSIRSAQRSVPGAARRGRPASRRCRRARGGARVQRRSRRSAQHRAEPVVSRSKTTNVASSSCVLSSPLSASPTRSPPPPAAAGVGPVTTSSSRERAIAVGAVASANSVRPASSAGSGPCRASIRSTRRSAASKESCTSCSLCEHTFAYNRARLSPRDTTPLRSWRSRSGRRRPSVRRRRTRARCA